MKKIVNFVRHTFKDIPKQGKEEIIQSVTELLNEKVEDLIEKGLSEQEAIDKTVVEFGTVEDYFVNFKKQEKKMRRKKTINHYKNDLFFSAVGSTIIIAIIVFVNLYYVPSTLWFVIPAVGILFWPLSILYNLLNKRENRKDEKDE